MMKKMFSLFLAVVLVFSCLATGAYATVTVAEDQFSEEQISTETVQQIVYSDTAGHWAESEIAYVTEKGYIEGFDIEFKPDEGMTRAMLVSAFASIARDMESADTDDSSADAIYEEAAEGTVSENESAEEKESSNVIYGVEGILFSDMTGDESYADDVAWAVDKGIINGINGAFCPDITVDRQTVSVMLFRFSEAMGIGLDSDWGIMLEYNDLEEADYWAIDGIAYCSMTGLMSGDPDGNFAPKRTLTRAESSAVIHRLCSGIEA